MKLTDLATRLARTLSRATAKDADTTQAAPQGAKAKDAAGRASARKNAYRVGATTAAPGASTGSRNGYLGDWHEALPQEPEWRPKRDGLPDPGEVVWARVPFEEDHSHGKDRPVLVVAISPRSTEVVLALPLTSKDHDRDAAQEARAGRHWMDVGTGAWDRSGRPSEARLDRVLPLRISDVRREGAALEEKVFREVYAAAQRMTGA